MWNASLQGFVTKHLVAMSCPPTLKSLVANVSNRANGWWDFLCMVLHYYFDFKIWNWFLCCSGRDHTVTASKVVVIRELGSQPRISVFMGFGPIIMMAPTHQTVIHKLNLIHPRYNKHLPHLTQPFLFSFSISRMTRTEISCLHSLPSYHPTPPPHPPPPPHINTKPHHPLTPNSPPTPHQLTHKKN